MRIVHNYILTGKDGKTAAERLGLAQAPAGPFHRIGSLRHQEK